MDRTTRTEWVRRGFKDPVAAYHGHAASAGARGIEFNITFAEWWALWEPHYEQRGTRTGEKVMCRTGDAGAYEVGNVRVDTVQGNAAERGQVFRAKNVAAGRLPTAAKRMALATQAPDDWLNRRTQVFRPYTEEEDSAL